ncbi:Maf family protein [Kordiimonas aquimaris]|uniref:Maf family protein n=1 Tax=Kordiimonas aquimaris TaxID=707591 RepID=UPI0021D2F5FC|nr:Maf family protein [Kordiimonas aquimaris]
MVIKKNWTKPEMQAGCLILASGSETRKRMLENAGVVFDTVPALIDEISLKESLISSGTTARNIADALADAKARSVSIINPDKLVLGADQTLVCGANIISKAQNTQSAKETLNLLSGRSHQLHSAAVMYENGQPIWRAVDTATLHMRPLSGSFIDDYLQAIGSDAFWSVGAYQIEGLGAQLFDKIEGNHFTILGLPLINVLVFLRQYGMLGQ